VFLVSSYQETPDKHRDRKLLQDKLADIQA
jgi:hypothetical protein